MAKCNRCGKKGLFIKLNSDGVCQVCERILILEAKEEGIKLLTEKLNSALADKEKLHLENAKAKKATIDNFINKIEPIKKLLEIVTVIAGAFVAIYYLFSSLYELQVINYYKLDISLFDPNTNALIIVLISILAAAALIMMLGTIIYCITIKKINEKGTFLNKAMTVFFNLLGIRICESILITNDINATIEVKYIFGGFICIFIYNIIVTLFGLKITEIIRGAVIKVIKGIEFKTKKNAIITVAFLIAWVFAITVNSNNEEIVNKKKFMTFTTKNNSEAFIIKKFKDNYIASNYNPLTNKKEVGYFIIDPKDGYVFVEKDIGNIKVIRDVTKDNKGDGN